MLIEVCLGGAEASHGDHQVSESALECFPVVNVVEQGDGEGFNPNLVQVSEQRSDAAYNQLHYEFFVGSFLMWHSLSGGDWLLQLTRFNDSNQLLHNLALHLEARQMSAVGHGLKYLLEEVHVELRVENLADIVI